MKTVKVKTAPEYQVVIAAGLLERCGSYIKQVHPACRAVVVTDSSVAPLYAGAAAASLEREGFETETFILPAGERSKTLQSYGALLSFMAEKEITRSDLLVALGGGVIGDLAGFAAASYQRGIAFVQLPTTLLAQIDSSVGGKTAVDLPQGKNLVGAFWQPRLVLCDTGCLSTLPPEAFADGMAEAIKYAMIADAGLLRRIRGDGMKDDAEGIIARCIEIKAGYVESDERDNGLRQLLNFGHTAGHAIERGSGFSITHGHAVAMGMALVTRAAIKRGIAPDGILPELEGALRQFSLPCGCAVPAKQLAAEAAADKKRRGGSITLALPVKLGECTLKSMPVAELEAFFADGMPG